MRIFFVIMGLVLFGCTSKVHEMKKALAHCMKSYMKTG